MGENGRKAGAGQIRNDGRLDVEGGAAVGRGKWQEGWLIDLQWTEEGAGREKVGSWNLGTVLREGGIRLAMEAAGRLGDVAAYVGAGWKIMAAAGRVGEVGTRKGNGEMGCWKWQREQGLLQLGGMDGCNGWKNGDAGTHRVWGRWAGAAADEDGLKTATWLEAMAATVWRDGREVGFRLGLEMAMWMQ